MIEKKLSFQEFQIITKVFGHYALIENDSTLYVTFKQYGNWWWKGGLGMSSYENEKYKVTTDEWCGYHLLIKNKHQHNYTIIYPDNLQWKEFIFEKH